MASASLERRGALLFGLLCAEVALLHAPYFGPIADLSAHREVAIVLDCGLFILLTAAAFVLVCWSERRSLLEDWRSAARGHDWIPRTAASTALALATLIGTLTSRHTSLGAAPLWMLVGGWATAALLSILLLVIAAAPASYWMALARQHRTQLLIAGGAVSAIWSVAELSQRSWDRLSIATLSLSSWLLRQSEGSVHVDPVQRLLGVDKFTVQIAPECSGYEGIVLVLGFLGLYMLAFRKQLKFPAALLLFPLGALSIWLLNAVRIALLVSIGAHVSPGMAMHGFHSQAGSLMFLSVAVGIMFAAGRLALFSNETEHVKPEWDSAGRRTAAFLGPFIVLMFGSLLSSMFLDIGRWLYVCEAAAVCGVLWFYRDVYSKLVASVSPVSVLLGLLVGITWVWTDPALGHRGPLDAWIGSLPPWSGGLWLTVRIFGLTMLVPIAEELAFRGYLHRALIARRWEAVAPGQFSWLAFLVSTAAFGAMHSRWLLALVAGAAYALVMYRSGRLSDPIVAHATSNAVIAVVAVVNQQWSLL